MSVRLGPTFSSGPLINTSSRELSRDSSSSSSRVSWAFLAYCSNSKESLVYSNKLGVVKAWTQEGSLQEIDDSLVSVDLTPISNETQFDRIVAQPHHLQESVIILWYFSLFHTNNNKIYLLIYFTFSNWWDFWFPLMGISLILFSVLKIYRFR